MKPAAVALLSLALLGCQPGEIREPVNRITLPGGLQVSHLPERGRAGRADRTLAIQLRSVGESPVVVCGLLGGDDGLPIRVFVHDPEPGTFRYEPSGDTIVAETTGGSPFRLAPAFRWYEMVLHPGAEPVTIELDPGGGVPHRRLLVEYVPVSYFRLARAAYLPPEEPAEADAAEAVVRYRRTDEEGLRRRSPRELFLRTSVLSRTLRTPIEIAISGAP